MNQEKIFQATNKMDSITHRCRGENENLEKEIEELKAEITKINKEHTKVQKRHKKLTKRLSEEKELTTNLKDICKRMKKGIRELTTWKEALRANTARQRKKKEKLEQNLVRVHQESARFYARAQKEAKR
jgi:uncharacterized protein YhaN